MWYLVILPAVVVCVLVAARRRWVVVRVTGPSMAPTYRPGDRVLIRRVAGSKLRRGQVVVFESAREGRWRTGPLPAPEGAKWLIKRVAALPGDPVPPDVARVVHAFDGALVPEGRLVVVGDGELSADSRHWGYLPADRVLGVVVRGLSPARTQSGEAAASEAGS
ncbi:S26 family signal peptidase [Microtetraspora sp. NBRC 13810]|uniref:S26 family signal peptidase n=1 Tax=Microtetraspora sp. NBRC 13810 TaxID=3030990 RepID=UPI0024A0A513|nr:S26 family signal peptidase [Microtetraspora sp. NBRC 13810]GLW11749.1 S26 family signal peptidase [Microtetraspora sp. NBRC 13810]